MTPPTAPTDTAPPRIERVITGQRLVIYAIAIQLLIFSLYMMLGAIANLIMIPSALLAIANLIIIPSIILAIVGTYFLTSGLRYSIFVQIFIYILLVMPYINLLTLALLNSQATRVLKAAGYPVGFLGVRR